jgi:hypothetical protein
MLSRHLMGSMAWRICLTKCTDSTVSAPCLLMGFHQNSYSTNLIEGVPVDRDMTTGKHTVREMFCRGCQNVVGWKYVSASALIYQYTNLFLAGASIRALTKV